MGKLILTKCQEKSPDAINNKFSIKEAKYLKRHKNIKLYLVSSLFLNVFLISVLIYLTTIII